MSNIFSRAYNSIFSGGSTKVVVGDESKITYIFWDGNNWQPWDFSPEIALKISTVYTCVGVRSDFISRMPVYLYDGTERQEDDLFYLLNYEPNPYTNSQTFWSILENFRSYTGNAYAIIHKQRKTNENPYGYGKAESFEIVHPDDVVGAAINKNNQKFYKVRRKDGEEEIHYSNLLHFQERVKFYKDGVHFGVNPIEALRSNLSINMNSLKAAEDYYVNGMKPQAFIESTIPTTNADKMKAGLDKWHKTYKNYNGKIIPLMPNTKLHMANLNFTDVQFLDTLKYNRSDIAAVYGLPPHWVGDSESSRYSDIENKTKDFKNDTVEPIVNMYEKELEIKLLTKEEKLKGKRIKFHTDVLVETDYKSRIESLRTLANTGAITINEIREKENLKPMPWGESPVVPGGFQPLTNLFNMNQETKKTTKDEE